MCRVQLEIEGRRFHSLLLLASELGEAVSKRVCDSKFHRYAYWKAMGWRLAAVSILFR